MMAPLKVGRSLTAAHGSGSVKVWSSLRTEPWVGSGVWIQVQREARDFIVLVHFEVQLVLVCAPACVCAGHETFEIPEGGTLPVRSGEFDV